MSGALPHPLNGARVVLDAHAPLDHRVRVTFAEACALLKRADDHWPLDRTFTVRHLTVLFYLAARAEPVRFKSICSALQLSGSALTHIADTLAFAGLAVRVRAPDAVKRVDLTLTESGRALARHVAGEKPDSRGEDDA